MTSPAASTLQQRLTEQLGSVYHALTAVELTQLVTELMTIAGISDLEELPQPYTNHWDQRDAVVITYGDSILQSDRHWCRVAIYLDLGH